MSPTSASRPATRFFDCAFLYGLAGLGQAIVLSSAFRGSLTELAALGYWLGFVFVAGVSVTLLAQRFEAHHAVALFIIGLGGPLGAVLSIIFCRAFIGARRKAPPELLSWYRTLAGRGDEFASNLADSEGDSEMTVLDPGAPTLAEIVRHGTLSQKRNAVARMAAAYHRDYHPLLMAALNDREPTIRVQAAAVLTGLGQEERDRLAARIKATASASTSELLEISDAIAQHVASRLLDAEGMRLAVLALGPIAAQVMESGTAEDHARLRLQLVWCAHHVKGSESKVLQGLLQKLLANQQFERAS